MLTASNRGAGMNIGAPDVCNTPVGPTVVPIPYPNFALNAQAVPFSPVVRLSMVNALNLGSKIPVTFGDDAGVAHPTVKGTGQYTMGNPVVYVDNLPAINLLCPTTGNNMNDGVGAVVVPSVTNVFYTLAGPPAGAELDAESLASLGETLAEPLCGPGEIAAEGPAEPGAAAIGVLRVRAFSCALPTLVHNEIRRLTGGGILALVIDLRGCPGGDLDACVRLAGDFLDRGLEIVRVVDADGDELVYRSRHGDPCTIPLALLVDRRTASAAEVFAACLQAHGRALVVGEATWGKGTAQRVISTEEGALHATVGRCARPGGAPIDGVGVVPDLPVKPADARAAAIRALGAGDPVDLAPPPVR
jgi:carboxyl-terminal processing protease